MSHGNDRVSHVVNKGGKESEAEARYGRGIRQKQKIDARQQGIATDAASFITASGKGGYGLLRVGVLSPFLPGAACRREKERAGRGRLHEAERRGWSHCPKGYWSETWSRSGPLGVWGGRGE